MTTVKIDIPFANTGTKTPIDDTRSDGVVSLELGYTDDYSRELGTDPLAKPVERDKLNYLFNVITTNVMDWQTMAFPQWLSTLGYAVNAFVRYSPTPGTTPERVYRCLNATSTGASPPLNNADWEELLTMAQLRANVPMPEAGIKTAAFNFNTQGLINSTVEIASDAVASGSANCPSQFAGMLESKLLNAPATSPSVQRYIDRQGSVFFRGQSGGTWSAWQTITGIGYTPANQAITITGTNGVTGGGDLSQNRTLSLANQPSQTLMGNGTGAAAAPTAVTLANGIQYNSTTALGLGAITPISVVTSSGGVTASNGIFGSATSVILGTVDGAAGNVSLRPNGVSSTTGATVIGSDGALNCAGVLRGTSLQAGNHDLPVGATTGFQITYATFNPASGANARNEYVNNYGTASGGHEFFIRNNTSSSVIRQVGIYGFLPGTGGNDAIRLMVYDNTGSNATIRGDGTFIGRANAIALAAGATGGGVYLRPNGSEAGAGQGILTATGTLQLNNGNPYNVPNNFSQGALLLGGNYGGGIAFSDTPGSWVQYTNSASILWRAVAGSGGTSAASGSGFSCDNSGNMVATGTIRPGSDERVKANRRPITGALQIVRDSLQGLLYERIDQKGQLESGFLAQELKKSLPHLVTVDGDDGTEGHTVPALTEDGKIIEGEFVTFKDFHHADYDHIVPYATTAIKELHDIVLEQRAMIFQLRRELNELKGQ